MRDDLVRLGPTFASAMDYAARLHAADHRKNKPWLTYLSHLLAVAAITLELGGDEEQAAAALLHDAVEDHPDRSPPERIEAEFGERIALIVVGCSDSTTSEKGPWRERKRKYIEHLSDADPDVLLVSYADKLHNGRSILDDLRASGVGYLEGFSGKRDGTLWYLRSLVEAFERRSSDLRFDVSPLGLIVTEIEAIAKRI